MTLAPPDSPNTSGGIGRLARAFAVPRLLLRQTFPYFDSSDEATMSPPCNSQNTAARGGNRYECQICLELFRTFSLETLDPKELQPPDVAILSQEGSSTTIGEVMSTKDNNTYFLANIGSALKTSNYPHDIHVKRNGPSPSVERRVRPPPSYSLHPVSVIATTATKIAADPNGKMPPAAASRVLRRALSSSHILAFENTSPLQPVRLGPQSLSSAQASPQLSLSPQQIHAQRFTFSPFILALDPMPRRVQPSQSGSLGLARLGAVWQPAEQLERQLKTTRDSIVQLQQQVDETYRRLALLSFVEHEGSRSADGGTNGLRHKTPNTPQGALHSANASARAGKVQPLTQQITATSKSPHGQALVSFSSSTSSLPSSIASSASPTANSCISSLSSSPSSLDEDKDIVLGYVFDCHPTHAFCLMCISKYLKGAIKERHWPINCPGTDCKSAVDHSVVEAALGSGAAEWYELGIEHGLKNKIYCPNPKCNLLMEREEASDKGKAPSRGQAFNCPYCRHYFCVECLAPGHPGKSCLEAKEYEREREQRQFEALVTENRWQRCPKCTIVIEKLAGCNHMKCTRCRKEFCYLCGGSHPCKRH